MRTLAILMALGPVGGCSAPPPLDVVGPFDGTTMRFYVATLHLPQQRSDFAVDLDDDGNVNNQLGNIVGYLEGQVLGNPFVDDVVAARVVDASVDIITTDPTLHDDAHVGVRWNGARGIEGDDSGGLLRDGVLTTNAVSWTRRPATGVIDLPLLADADATELPLESWQLELYRQDDGSFTGELQAVVAADVLAGAVYPTFHQMLDNDVARRGAVLRTLDRNRDGDVSFAEFATAGLLQNLLAPDTRWHSTEKNAMGIAVGLELRACVDAQCTRPLPPPTCHDRLRNGDETGVDCGGSCDACAQPLDHARASDSR